MTEAPTTKSADWVRRVIAENPCRAIDGGNYVTCPVRFGFPNVDKAQPAMDDDGKPKYTLTPLFQAGSDISPLKQALAETAQAEWGSQLEQYMALDNFHKPIKDQGSKQYDGFTPGLPFFTASSERKPAVVMQNMAPFTGRVYPGQWGILIVRPFAFNRRNKQGVVVKRGLSFGLQSVMIVADDTEFGGGSVDPHKAFAGVKIDADVNPSAMFGQAAGTDGAKAPTAADLFG